MLNDILIAVIPLGAVALVFGALLAIAGKIFEVKEDERISEIEQVLPNANCGACGYAGCSAYASAIVKDNALCNLCPVGGNEVSTLVSSIMGVEAKESVRFRAVVMCQGGAEIAADKFRYEGANDCYTASKLGGGKKECPYGCIGLGNCVRECQFGAIKIENSVAVVDYNKCKACGMCKKSCPKNIIELVPYDTKYFVACCSQDKGAITKKYCKKGCIGCGLCMKSCESGAIKVTNFKAAINVDKCTKCGKCVTACPMGTIIDLTKN